MKRILTTLLIMLALQASGLGMTAPEDPAPVLQLYGKVVDGATFEPLAYASVSLRGTVISNVTNSEGVFSLKIPGGTSPEAIINVSFLGYLTAAVPVGSISSADPEEPYVIRMTPVSMNLDPAVVHASEPYFLFKSAYYKVKDNYPDYRVGMTSFYREIIRRGSGKYLVLNEAVVDIDKASYSTFGADRAAIYKGRGSQNYDASDSLFVQFQGGITTALSLDMVKNPFVSCTLPEAEEYYDFSMGEPVSTDGKTFYVVQFDPKPSEDWLYYRGKVYIESETLAIGRLEFYLDVEGHEEEAASYFIIKRPSGKRFYVTRAEYVINYKETDGLWYYDYCLMNVDFYYRQKGSPFRHGYSLMGEMAVTDHKKGDFTIIPADRVRFKDILSERITDFTDEDFWEDYNIIEPDQSIDVIIKRIVRQLGRRER